MKKASYRPGIVTFIDILGFSSIVAERSASEISDIVKELQDNAGSDDEEIVAKFGLEEKSNWTRNYYFSDSVLRVRPYDGKYREGSLFRELLDLVHAQAHLAQSGIWLRGGLTVGDIFVGDSVAFGPALKRAYDLESSFAKYPRIVLGPEVFEKFTNEPRLRSQRNEYEWEKDFLGKLLRRSDDGLHYVDYLGAIRRELGYDEDYPNILARVKTLIVQSASQARENLSVLQKYLWLAQYLNAVAAEHDDCSGRSDIVICGSDIFGLAGFC